MDLIVLDGTDVPDPQNMAMLQALYSRDPSSVKSQLSKLRNVTKFMDNYVVKYGHSSIAQCGYVTIFAEGVSMYLAKVIEHHNYYCGQETSSRYVNFAEQGCVRFSPAYDAIQDKWLAIYDKALIEFRNKVAYANFATYYNNLDDSQKKQVNPRAFDLARGFIPFGAKTNVSWTTNFDNLWKHLSWIKEHFQVPEMQEFVNSLELQIRAKYPDSFPALLGEEGTGASRENMGNSAMPMLNPSEFGPSNSFRISFLQEHIAYAPELPELFEPETDDENKRKQLITDVYIRNQIDLGSWRDLQRHRNTVQAWPNWTDKLNVFYIDGLSYELQLEIYALWEETKETIYREKNSDMVVTWRDESWLLMPLAVNIEFGLKMSLFQMFYIIRARYQETVHATARRTVYEWFNMYLRETMPDKNEFTERDLAYTDKVLNREGLRWRVMESAGNVVLPDNKYTISVKRANQTIEEKK